MLYLSLFCLNLSYKSLDVYNSGGAVVPNSDVYKYSDPTFLSSCPHSLSALPRKHPQIMSAKFDIFNPHPLDTVEQFISTVVCFGPTPSPPQQHGRHLSMLPPLLFPGPTTTLGRIIITPSVSALVSGLGDERRRHLCSLSREMTELLTASQF